MRVQRLTLSPEELDGDLPLICVRTGNVAEGLSPVWFTRSQTWAWVPLGLLVGWAVAGLDWGVLASWWAIGTVVLPLITSRGVTGNLPLDTTIRRRMADLRARRVRVLVAALMLTWVAVTLHLIGSRVAAVMVLGLVIALYALGLGMFLAGRLLAVRGRPERGGGATLRDVHPAFADAVALHRTGHRP